MPTLELTTNVLSISRHFKAPRERVFAAFATIEAMGAWIGCDGSKIIGGTLDFQVRGKYQMRMNTPHGECLVTGSYQEITPPSRIVFTWHYQDDPDWTGVDSVVTIELQSRGAETELTLTHAGLPTPESRDNHEFGWSESCDKLALYLAA